MKESIVPFYNPGVTEPQQEYFATSNEGEDKHSAGAISYVIGSDEVMIRSTDQKGYGAIPIKGFDNLKLLRNALIKICDFEEFNTLFEELTGIRPQDAKKDEDGFLFVPPEVQLGEKDTNKRKRLSELNGYEWRNHIVNDEYSGWWVGTPMRLIS